MHFYLVSTEITTFGKGSTQRNESLQTRITNIARPTWMIYEI